MDVLTPLFLPLYFKKQFSLFIYSSISLFIYLSTWTHRFFFFLFPISKFLKLVLPKYNFTQSKNRLFNFSQESSLLSFFSQSLFQPLTPQTYWSHFCSYFNINFWFFVANIKFYTLILYYETLLHLLINPSRSFFVASTESCHLWDLFLYFLLSSPDAFDFFCLLLGLELLVQCWIKVVRVYILALCLY